MAHLFPQGCQGGRRELSRPGAGTVMTSTKGDGPARPMGCDSAPGRRPSAGRHGGQEGGASHAAAAAHDQTVPTDRLWSRLALRPHEQAGPPQQQDVGRSSQIGGMPMGTITTSPESGRPAHEVAHFGRVHGDREVGRHGRAGDLAGAGVHAAGDVDGDDWGGVALMSSMASAAAPLAAPLKPVPKMASTTRSESLRSRLVALATRR